MFMGGVAVVNGAAITCRFGATIGLGDDALGLVGP
jgi:hypothetical protein